MRKSFLMFLIIVMFCASSDAQNYSRIFTSIYSDSSAGNLTINDMAVDAAGNSYMAGYKIFSGDQYYQTHLFVLKVNAAGTQEWIRYFNNKFDSIDVAYAVATDAAGNVYVTGKRIDTFCNICTYSTKYSSIITMKYDAAGNLLWLNRYSDSIYHLASPSDIALAADGSILITGNENFYNVSQASHINTLLIEKIDKSGNTIFTQKILHNFANAGSFDNTGNIIVAGAADADNLYQTQKPEVFKFLANGKLLWNKIFDEYGKNGRLYFIGCDSLNNIYANGQTDTIAYYNNPKIITIKFNPDGVQQWFRKEKNETTTMPHFYGDFRVTSAGNSYITGTVSAATANNNWLTTTYNTAGARQWINYFDDSLQGSDVPVALAVNKNITYITGYSYYAGNYAITTVAYNKNGYLVGEDIFKAGRNTNGFAAGIGLDKTGSIYISGEISSYSNPHPSLIVIKYGIRKTFAVNNSSSIKTISDIKLFQNPVENNLNLQKLCTFR